MRIKKAPNEYGIYGATVSINGAEKYSTFFPDNWTPQQVLDAIDEAYEKGEIAARRKIKYTLDSGVSIEINLDNNGKIRSAYPKYEEGS